MRALVVAVVAVLAFSGCGGDEPEFNEADVRAVLVDYGLDAQGVDMLTESTKNVCTDDNEMMIPVYVDKVNAGDFGYEVPDWWADMMLEVVVAGCPAKVQKLIVR